jgi:hypothetical protein
MKVYNDHVFTVRESRNHGMQVFDLTKLREYYDKPSAFVRQLAHGVLYDEVTSVHNIIINEQTGFGYLVGSKTCSGGLHVVDLSTPIAPRFVGCFSADGYTHDSQCVIYDGPDANYRGKEICFNYNEDTLTIVDVSDKTDMKMISRMDYDNNYVSLPACHLLSSTAPRTSYYTTPHTHQLSLSLSLALSLSLWRVSFAHSPHFSVCKCLVSSPSFAVHPPRLVDRRHVASDAER